MCHFAEPQPVGRFGRGHGTRLNQADDRELYFWRAGYGGSKRRALWNVDLGLSFPCTAVIPRPSR